MSRMRGRFQALASCRGRPAFINCGEPQDAGEMGDDPFMQRAVALALEKMRANDGGPFGAVIVRNGEDRRRRLESRSPRPAIRPRMPRWWRSPSLRQAQHLRSVGLRDLTSCSRVRSCLGAVYWARLRTLYFANTRGEAAGIGFDDAFIY